MPMGEIALLALLAVQHTDTTVAVRTGSRLELDNFEGTVDVTTWNRSAVRVQATHESRTDIEVDVSGPVVSIRSSGRHGQDEVEYRLTVPAAIDLEITGHSGSISADGTTGRISIETVEGSIKVRGGTGIISLHSVEGGVMLSGARGRIEINSVDGDIRLSDIAGEIQAEAVDGEIDLDGIESEEVEANTVDGSITYRGVIKDGGRYRFASHDGDVTVTVPQISAAVTVSTFDGEFCSDFPVTLTNTRSGKRMSFTLGSGSARLELESFDGVIELRKAGTASSCKP